MKTLVTVDWDFFVPEDPAWDLGHKENLLFLKMLWSSRVGLMGVMKTTGDEAGFWRWLREGVERERKDARLVQPLWVSDSHCYAYTILDFNRVRRVVLFDAHHDCWPGEKGKVMCHNWLRAWLKGSAKREAVWVVPAWQDRKVCRLPEDMVGRVEVVGFRDGLELGLEGPVAVHVCRSGCWTPPWLDKAFLGFLEGFRGDSGELCRMQDGEWDPLVERWMAKDLAEALKNEAKVRKLVAGMAVGSVPSSSFAGAKVECAV